MLTRFTLPLVALLGATAIVLALASASSFQRRLELEHHAGEVARLDEVLTMSARLAAATGEGRWKARYEREVAVLDRELEQALALGGEAARDAIAQTAQSNQALVALEERSLALTAAGELPAARALLDGTAYEAHKQAYAAGVRGALEAGASEARRAAAVFSAATAVTGVLLVVVLAALVRQRRAAAVAAQALEVQQAQSAAMRTTLSTVMDTVNNALNGLTLFRLKAEERHALSAHELAEFDHLVEGASQRLTQMGNLPEFRTRAVGSLKVLDVPPAGKPTA